MWRRCQKHKLPLVFSAFCKLIMCNCNADGNKWKWLLLWVYSPGVLGVWGTSCVNSFALCVFKRMISDAWATVISLSCNVAAQLRCACARGASCAGLFQHSQFVLFHPPNVLCGVRGNYRLRCLKPVCFLCYALTRVQGYWKYFEGVWRH